MILLFVKCTDACHIIFSLYVDHMIVISDGISVLKAELDKQFEM